VVPEVDRGDTRAVNAVRGTALQRGRRALVSLCRDAITIFLSIVKK
jgi:hypothetical protein